MLGLYLWCAKRHGRELLWLLMLAGSLVFYGWNSVRYLPVLLGSMAVNYGIGYKLCGGTEEQQDGNRKKSLLAAGLLIDILLLACFKYLDTGTYKPLSISFFTFTQIAFLMECYRGNLKRTGFLPYGIYVTWFPKMIQGPIALPGEILPELEKKASFVGWEKLYRCCYLFVLGLFKKVLIADTLGKAVDLGYESLGTLNSADAVIVMLAYTLQLYFDFSGYCDMAMGISGSFGLELPLNFDSPYRAANILEFWKGWHITLTRFFTKYLYIPLGGNRKGRWRTYWNCLLVFVISGLWHGEGINFLIWGLMLGDYGSWIERRAFFSSFIITLEALCIARLQKNWKYEFKQKTSARDLKEFSKSKLCKIISLKRPDLVATAKKYRQKRAGKTITAFNDLRAFPQTQQLEQLQQLQQLDFEISNKSYADFDFTQICENLGCDKSEIVIYCFDKETEIFTDSGWKKISGIDIKQSKKATRTL